MVTKWLFKMVTKKCVGSGTEHFRGVWLQFLVKSWYDISMKLLHFVSENGGNLFLQKTSEPSISSGCARNVTLS